MKYTIMSSSTNAVNIFDRIPPELVSITFNYLNGLDIIHFINRKKEEYVSSLNITEDELNVWNLMNNSDNKI